MEGGEGDRRRPVPWVSAQREGVMFLNLNRGKRGIALDLERPAARAALLRQAAGADVFVHSMRAEAIARLGLTYADVSAANPRIIYANVYGFSRRGPYAPKAAYDDIIQAISGMAGIQALLQGQPSYSGPLVAAKVPGLTVL